MDGFCLELFLEGLHELLVRASLEGIFLSLEGHDLSGPCLHGADGCREGFTLGHDRCDIPVRWGMQGKEHGEMGLFLAISVLLLEEHILTYDIPHKGVSWDRWQQVVHWASELDDAVDLLFPDEQHVLHAVLSFKLDLGCRILPIVDTDTRQERGTLDA